MSFEMVVGWVLVHSVWQVAALGLLLLLFCHFAKSAHVRYLAALFALFGCVAFPVATALALGLGRHDPLPAPSHGVVVGGAVVKYRTPAAMPAVSAAPRASLSEKIEPVLPVVVRFWLAGLILMSFRLLGGLFAVARLRRAGTADVEGRWQGMADDIGRKLGVRRPIRLLLSAKIEVPTVLGAFKSVVLLPASMVLRLSPGQIEALLTHEIAHIRRYDYLVNLIQSVIETVLFFHPAVWWISSIVRSEREHCCDDLAIRSLGDPQGYARALVLLEESRRGSPRLSMAADGNNLLQRIRRISSGSHRPISPSSAWTAAALVLLAGGVLAGRIHAQQTHSRLTSIRGRVFLSSGKPASGATVAYESADGTFGAVRTESTVAAPDGSYLFQVGPSKGHSITAYLRNEGVGHADESGRIRLIPPTPVQIRLVDTNGAPLAGVRVGPNLIQRDSNSYVPLGQFTSELSAESDAHGLVTIHDLPANVRAVFTVEDARYAIKKQPDYIDPSRARELVLQPAASLNGVLTQNGRPVAGAAITGLLPTEQMEPRAQTDAEGRFRLDSLPPGQVILGASLPASAGTNWVVEMKEVPLSAGRTANAELVAVKGTSLTVKVVDRDGKPAANASVDIDKAFSGSLHQGRMFLLEATETCDSNGIARLSVPEGRHECFAHTSQGLARQVVEIRGGQEAKFQLRLEARAPRTSLADLRCLIRDSGGRPVRWASIRYSTHRGEEGVMAVAQTNQDGVAGFSVPSASHGPVRVSMTDGKEFGELTASPGGTYTVRLRAVQPSSISGVAKDPLGRPVKGIAVQMPTSSMFVGEIGLYHGLRQRLTGADGRYRFSGLFPDQDVSLWSYDRNGASINIPPVHTVPGRDIERDITISR